MTKGLASLEASTSEMHITNGEADGSKPFRFLALPGELRDQIYHYTLVQEFPIEFAPYAADLVEGFLSENQHNEGWYYERYDVAIRPSLKLLRVNKQINEEAAPVYYGQPFRFTNQIGEVVLYNWLQRVGKRNRSLIKDVSYCHPTFRRRYCLHSTLESINLRTVEPLMLYHKLLTSKTSFHGSCSCDTCNPSALPLLLESKALRSLRLTLPLPETFHVYADMELDPIHKTNWHEEYPEVQRTVVNLRRVNQPLVGEMPLAGLEEPHVSALLWIPGYNGWSPGIPDPTYQERVSHIEAGRRAFRSLAAEGWQVTEEAYDRHIHYPVQSDEACKNRSLCAWARDLALRETCEPIYQPPCNGTVRVATKEWEDMVAKDRAAWEEQVGKDQAM